MAQDTIELTAQIVAAYLSQNRTAVTEIPALISTVHGALNNISQPVVEQESAEPLKPAVPIKKSVTPEFIICLEDGKQCKMLKRHLMASFGLTPDEYRAKWGLPSDYPMVAPNYAKARSTLAHSIGLGQRRKAAD